LERVLEVIRRDINTDKVRVDNPTQNLESYFLDVVEKAKRAAAETSGATSGARVAAYLRGDAEAQPSSEKILERLTLPQAQQPAPAPAVAPVKSADEQKLDDLTKPSAPASPQSKPVQSAETKPDLSKADEKLSSLLGDKK
jgi:hypothetical protein